MHIHVQLVEGVGGSYSWAIQLGRHITIIYAQLHVQVVEGVRGSYSWAIQLYHHITIIYAQLHVHLSPPPYAALKKFQLAMCSKVHVWAWRHVVY